MSSFLGYSAIAPAAASVYFFFFWTFFDFWRRHRTLTYFFLFGSIIALLFAVDVHSARVFAIRYAFPSWAHVAGWIVISLSLILGTVADRQIGIHIRSFAPFFSEDEKIPLTTTGAYGLVRHPIYASGVYYQLGAFLVTGYLAVAIALITFLGGALWFTRQEEKRLIERLADPAEYERYRKRVGRLFLKLW
jgi:protein-S-isoprenylcysteine O-methyltransferase Ste14